MILLQTIKHICISVFDFIGVILGYILFIISALCRGSLYAVLALVGITIIGLISSVNLEIIFVELMFMTIPVLIIGFIMFLLVVIILGTLIVTGKGTFTIGTWLIKRHNEADFAWSNHIRNVTSTRKERFAFITCYISERTYSCIKFVLRLLYIPAIIFTVGVIAYFIYSCTVNFTDPLAELFIYTFDYFTTGSKYFNVFSAILFIAGILSIIVQTTLNLKNDMDFLDQLRGMQYEAFLKLTGAFEECYEPATPITRSNPFTGEKDSEEYLIISKKEYNDLKSNTRADT